MSFPYAGLLPIAVLWLAVGAYFLRGATLGRYVAAVILWQIVTPDWPLWIDTPGFLVGFTLFEMAYRALAENVRSSKTRRTQEESAEMP